MFDYKQLGNAILEVTTQWENSEKELWHQTRLKEALQIDALTAEIMCSWVNVVDPYGLCENVPDELVCVGRVYFARAPGSDIWVCFYDLPEAIAEALECRKHEADASYDNMDWLDV